MTNSEKITQKMEAVCLQILRDSRSELYLNMRYLDLALSGLRFSISTQIEGIGTDGEYLVAHPGVLADLFQKDRHLVNRVYLHIVLHCLMCHLFKKPGRDGLLWRISCDIAVNQLLIRCTAGRSGWASAGLETMFMTIFAENGRY